MKNRRLNRRKYTSRRGQTRKSTLHAEIQQRAAEVLAEIRVLTGPGVEPRTLVRLRRVDPLVFERIVLQTFAELPGYRVRYNCRFSGDGGVDGRVYDPNGKPILRAELNRWARGYSCSTWAMDLKRFPQRA